MGKVAAIKHGDQVVTECAAICAYLADAFSESNLAPAVGDRTDYYRCLFFSARPLESAITNKSLGFETDQQQQRMAGYGTYDLTLSALDDLIGSRDYVCGERFTAADVYLGSLIDFGL
jgi:glutathione S-transferase